MPTKPPSQKLSLKAKSLTSLSADVVSHAGEFESVAIGHHQRRTPASALSWRLSAARAISKPLWNGYEPATYSFFSFSRAPKKSVYRRIQIVLLLAP